MTHPLPERPPFASIEAAAPETANRRTLILALIGNLVFSWSNNESMFIYVLMLLLRTNERAAAVTFATLNTTRARLDLVQRLARVSLTDEAVAARLEGLIERFNECTRVRNEFNHCMYGVNEAGDITHTHSMRIQDSRGRLTFGTVKPMDDERLREMTGVIAEMRTLNRDLWDILPVLQASLRQADNG